MLWNMISITNKQENSTFNMPDRVEDSAADVSFGGNDNISSADEVEVVARGLLESVVASAMRYSPSDRAVVEGRSFAAEIEGVSTSKSGGGPRRETKIISRE